MYGRVVGKVTWESEADREDCAAKVDSELEGTDLIHTNINHAESREGEPASYFDVRTTAEVDGDDLYDKMESYLSQATGLIDAVLHVHNCETDAYDPFGDCEAECSQEGWRIIQLP